MKRIDKFHDEKQNLINSLSSKGIFDVKILNAINTVPREKFISNDLVELAYSDRALPIDNKQTISQPYTVAFMTQLLDLKSNMKVLEIGTGSGYQAAILCEMGADVYSIERIESLYEKVKFLLKSLGYYPQLFNKDGTLGLSENAPFDRIIFTAGAPFEPLHLIDQLSIGGKLVVPVGDKDSQVMKLIVKTDKNNFNITEHSRFKFVPLIGAKGWQEL